MKYLIIFTMIFMCSVSCKAQNLPNSIKNEIIEYYIDINEIQEKDREKIISNFRELVSITDLRYNNIRYSNEKMGIYKVSLNISHTTSSILICNSKCKFYISKGSYIDLLLSITSYINENNIINKEESIKYIESYIRMIKENEEINQIDRLEVKEN